MKWHRNKSGMNNIPGVFTVGTKHSLIPIRFRYPAPFSSPGSLKFLTVRPGIHEILNHLLHIYTVEPAPISVTGSSPSASPRSQRTPVA